jgi:hypothetical protein
MPSAQQVQAVVEEILRRKEFSDVAEKEPSQSHLQRPLNWLSEQSVFGLISVGRLIGWIILGTLAIVLLSFLLRMILAEIARLRASRIPADRSGGEGEQSGQEPSALLHKAEGALSASDMRQSLQLLSRACIAALARAGYVVVEQWKTNNAYLRECPRAVEQYPFFGEAISLHEDLVYGHRAPDPARIRRLLTALQGFCQGL